MSAEDEERRYRLLTRVGWIWGWLGMIGMFPAGMSCMLLDAPGSEKNRATVVLVLSIATFPIVCLVSNVACSIAKRLESRWFDWIAQGLPLLNIVAGATAAFWITYFQDGKLSPVG